MTILRYFCGVVSIFFLFCLPTNSFANDNEFTIKIIRNMTCIDQATIGSLYVNDVEIGRTLELPWRDNKTDISRVPPGTYDAFIRSNGNKKWRIQLSDVTDIHGHTRSAVQIHIGNYQDDIEGCILVGSDIKMSGNKCMVPDSRKTLDRLASEMAKFARSLNQNQSSNIKIQVRIE